MATPTGRRSPSSTDGRRRVDHLRRAARPRRRRRRRRSAAGSAAGGAVRDRRRQRPGHHRRPARCADGGRSAPVGGAAVDPGCQLEPARDPHRHRRPGRPDGGGGPRPEGADLDALSAARPACASWWGPRTCPSSAGDPRAIAIPDRRPGGRHAAHLGHDRLPTDLRVGAPQRHRRHRRDGGGDGGGPGRPLLQLDPALSRHGSGQQLPHLHHHRDPAGDDEPARLRQGPVDLAAGRLRTGATISWSPNFGFAITAQRVNRRRSRRGAISTTCAAVERRREDPPAHMEAFADRFERYGLERSALRTNFGCAENIGGATFTRAGEPFRSESVDAATFHERQVAVSTDGTGRASPSSDAALRIPASPCPSSTRTATSSPRVTSARSRCAPAPA